MVQRYPDTWHQAPIVESALPPRPELPERLGTLALQEPRRLGDLLRARVQGDPRSIALQIPGQGAWSWERLAGEVASIQSGLRRIGVEPGDRVAIMCENSFRMAASLCGIVGLGAVAVPVNTSLVSSGLEHVLRDSGASALIGDAAYLSRYESLPTKPLGDRPRICVDDGGPGESWSKFLGGEDDLVSEGKPSDPAMILYTSGTTGRAKGVVLSHTCCLTATAASANELFEAASDDVLYTCLPLYHCAAQRLGFWTSVYSGAQLVLATRFSASQFWPEIRTFGVTKFHFIGPMISVLWQAPPTGADRDHRAWLAVGGGPRTVYREFEERFGVTFVETYGMTESFGGCVGHRPNEGRAGTVGKALAHVEIAISPVDELAAGREQGKGEIVIRPKFPNAIFSGYHNRPDLTDAAFSGGWFKTGDLGAIDKDGYLTFYSRIRDIIRRRGENISAVEVEDTIAQHPSVGESAVVGVPAEVGEEEILAVIVPRAANVDLPALVAYLQEQLPRFAVPRFFAISDRLPKTATGRVKRHELAEFLSGAVDMHPPVARHDKHRR